MDIKEKVTLANSCIKAILFKRKRPIFVSWYITERCNLQCRYCNVWQRKSLELETKKILDIIKTLHKKGTRMIRFTGGEPLLRDDIAMIINYSRKLGIITTISTNGILLPERIKEIDKLDGITISLDGPEDIHDSIRGKGSYKVALEALVVAKKKDIPLSISTALNSLNLESPTYLLSIAKRFNTRIFFQPATKIVLYGERPNPISPDVDQYREVILFLVKLKKRCKFIGNSMTGLKHLYYWPQKKPINCVAGKIICRLDSQGNLGPCSRFIIRDNKLNVPEKGMEYYFNQLYSPDCGYCWCSSLVELNLISRFNINAILNAVTLQGRSILDENSINTLSIRAQNFF